MAGLRGGLPGPRAPDRQWLPVNRVMGRPLTSQGGAGLLWQAPAWLPDDRVPYPDQHTAEGGESSPCTAQTPAFETFHARQPERAQDRKLVDALLGPLPLGFLHAPQPQRAQDRTQLQLLAGELYVRQRCAAVRLCAAVVRSLGVLVLALLLEVRILGGPPSLSEEAANQRHLEH